MDEGIFTYCHYLCSSSSFFTYLNSLALFGLLHIFQEHGCPVQLWRSAYTFYNLGGQGEARTESPLRFPRFFHIEPLISLDNVDMTLQSASAWRFREAASVPSCALPLPASLPSIHLTVFFGPLYHLLAPQAFFTSFRNMAAQCSYGEAPIHFTT